MLLIGLTGLYHRITTCIIASDTLLSVDCAGPLQSLKRQRGATPRLRSACVSVHGPMGSGKYTRVSVYSPIQDGLFMNIDSYFTDSYSGHCDLCLSGVGEKVSHATVI